MPGLDKALAIAEVAKVDLYWLATGAGAKSPENAQSEQVDPRRGIDTELLVDVVAVVEKFLHRRQRQMPDAAKAQFIAFLYETFEDPESRQGLRDDLVEIFASKYQKESIDNPDNV